MLALAKHLSKLPDIFLEYTYLNSPVCSGCHPGHDLSAEQWRLSLQSPHLIHLEYLLRVSHFVNVPVDPWNIFHLLNLSREKSNKLQKYLLKRDENKIRKWARRRYEQKVFFLNNYKGRHKSTFYLSRVSSVLEVLAEAFDVTRNKYSRVLFVIQKNCWNGKVAA